MSHLTRTSGPKTPNTCKKSKPYQVCSFYYGEKSKMVLQTPTFRHTHPVYGTVNRIGFILVIKSNNKKKFNFIMGGFLHGLCVVKQIF